MRRVLVRSGSLFGCRSLLLSATPRLLSSSQSVRFSGAAASSAPTNSAPSSLKLFDDYLTIRVGSDEHAFHFFWLYHNCDSFRHPTTKERMIDVPDVPLDIRPRKVNVFNDVLHLTWPGQRQSQFTFDWLVRHSYSINHQPVTLPGSDVVNMIQIDYPELQRTSKNLEQDFAKRIVECVERHGCVVVRKFGDDVEKVIRELLPPGEDVWESHFGRIEDLRTDNTTNKNTDQLGYTNAAVAPHTDMPFRHDCPSMQLLLSMRKADIGGESYLVDARAAARYLRSTNPWAYDMLRTIPVKFHRKQKDYEAVTHYPLIQTMGDHIYQIRYSYFTMSPFRVPFEWMRLWYQAYGEFAKILHDEKFQFRFLLEPGDFVLYSNLTMVHARESFSGSRWVKGVYFSQDRVLANLKSKFQ